MTLYFFDILHLHAEIGEFIQNCMQERSFALLCFTSPSVRSADSGPPFGGSLAEELHLESWAIETQTVVDTEVFLWRIPVVEFSLLARKVKLSLGWKCWEKFE